LNFFYNFRHLTQPNLSQQFKLAQDAIILLKKINAINSKPENLFALKLGSRLVNPAEIKHVDSSQQ
jgi:hypothetical protein